MDSTVGVLCILYDVAVDVTVFSNFLVPLTHCTLHHSGDFSIEAVESHEPCTIKFVREYAIPIPIFKSPE